MSNLPKIYTQQDRDAKDRGLLENGSERDRLLMLLRAFSGSRSSLPMSDDYGKIQADATHDFRRSDYSEAESYVDSLVRLVEFYKELAENYLNALTDYGIPVDDYGCVSGYPFVLTEDGEEVLGRVEVLALEDHASEDLWRGYVKPFLGFATDSEREWIVKTFSEQIKEDGSGDD